MKEKSAGKIFGLIVGALVSGILGIVIIANENWFFGIVFAVLAGILAGFAADTATNNDRAFQITGVTVMIVLIVVGLIVGATISADSGPDWGDLSDEEKENARWAYEVKEWIDDQE